MTARAIPPAHSVPKQAVEILSGMDKAKGGRGKTGDASSLVSMGITGKQSSRWQRAAMVGGVTGETNKIVVSWGKGVPTLGAYTGVFSPALHS